MALNKCDIFKSSKLVVRADQDSDLQALFDTVLNPNSSRPQQVPLRMRKLPDSFFNPPLVGSKSLGVSHSRENSADSACSSVGVDSSSGGGGIGSLGVAHLRAHSSPATLQQTYGCGKKQVCNEVQPHAKRSSYDFGSVRDEMSLPVGWELGWTSEGLPYYINHITRTTTWEDPRKSGMQRITEQNHEMRKETQSQAQNNWAFEAENVVAGEVKPVGAGALKPVVAGAAAPVTSGTAGPVITGVAAPATSSVTAPLTAGAASNLSTNALLGPLPAGWEQSTTPEGEIYFINHLRRTTSWLDPRISMTVQEPSESLLPPTTWLNPLLPQAQIDVQETQQEIHLRSLEMDLDILEQRQDEIRFQQELMLRTRTDLPINAFLSQLTDHPRQESADSGLEITSYSVSHSSDDFMAHIDAVLDNMNYTSESDIS